MRRIELRTAAIEAAERQEEGKDWKCLNKSATAIQEVVYFKKRGSVTYIRCSESSELRRKKTFIEFNSQDVTGD